MEIDGKKVVKHIYRTEEICSAPYLANAPDLVLIAEKGFNLKGSMAVQKLAGKGPFTGKHTYHDAFLLISDKEAASTLGDKPSVIDAGKLIQTLACRS